MVWRNRGELCYTKDEDSAYHRDHAAQNGVAMSKQKWIVIVDDNFAFMDPYARYKDGEYDTYDEAVAKCKAIVDDYLDSALQPGMVAEELYTSYTMFGEDPFIIGNRKYKYSSWDYAKARCKILTKQ